MGITYALRNAHCCYAIPNRYSLRNDFTGFIKAALML